MYFNHYNIYYNCILSYSRCKYVHLCDIFYGHCINCRKAVEIPTGTELCHDIQNEHQI